MRRKSFKLDNIITVLRVPLALFGCIYLISMFVSPWIMGGWRWSYVQDVWDRWQGVNVGILAFAAGFIAFEITRYNESRQSQREFLAARAFLPEALSALTTYLEESAQAYMVLWNSRHPNVPLRPSNINDVFASCIRHADAETGEQLAYILTWLQIHHSRLQQYIATTPSGTASKRLDVLYGLRLVGELQARVNKLFEFARGMGGLDSRPLAWDDYKAAYVNLGLHIEDLTVGKFSLQSMTEGRIKRSND